MLTSGAGELNGTSAVAATERPAARAAGRRRRRRGALAWALGTALAGVVLFSCYLRQSRTVSVGSDGASQALQAWDLLHGNLLLHGWWVTDVSFYTTELPQYALIELARGLSADVIHVAGAMTYTLLVLTAAFLAYPAQTVISQGDDPPHRAGGAAGLTGAVLAAGIMLAPQLGQGTQTLVLSPDHTGTCVPVLLIFLLIDRAPSRWYVPVLVWLGLAWTALADAMTIFVAIIPLAVVCAIRLINGLAVRRETFAGHRREVSFAAAAVLAVPAELAVAALIRAQGGWQVNGLRTALAGAGQLAGNMRLTGEGLLELFGANVFDAATGLGTALAAVHLVGLALAVAGVLAATRGFLNRDRRGTFIEAVLVTGIVTDLAAYLAGVQAVNLLSTREIAPVLPFAAVLAGRLLGARFSTPGRPLRCAIHRPGPAPRCAIHHAATGAWLQPARRTRGLRRRTRLRRRPAARRPPVRGPGRLAARPSPHNGAERLPPGQRRDPGNGRRGHPSPGGTGHKWPPRRLHLECQRRLVRPGRARRDLPGA